MSQGWGARAATLVLGAAIVGRGRGAPVAPGTRVVPAVLALLLGTALGVGLASAIRGRNPLTDGFGLIAFASLSPIIFVLIFGML